MGAKNINLLIALAFISQQCVFLLDFSILFESNCVYLGFNLIAVFCCPLDATMVVKEAKILQNFPEIPSQVMKDLILVLIALVSKYLSF